jgi:malic enzyme
LECRYIFPGLAFGAHLAKSGIVTDAMLTAAAEAIPVLLTDQQLKEGRVYPDLNNIRCHMLEQ